MIRYQGCAFDAINKIDDLDRIGILTGIDKCAVGAKGHRNVAKSSDGFIVTLANAPPSK